MVFPAATVVLAVGAAVPLLGGGSWPLAVGAGAVTRWITPASRSASRITFPVARDDISLVPRCHSDSSGSDANHALIRDSAVGRVANSARVTSGPSGFVRESLPIHAQPSSVCHSVRLLLSRAK